MGEQLDLVGDEIDLPEIGEAADERPVCLGLESRYSHLPLLGYVGGKGVGMAVYLIGVGLPAIDHGEFRIVIEQDR